MNCYLGGNPQDDTHQEENLQRQVKQAEFYNRVDTWQKDPKQQGTHLRAQNSEEHEGASCGNEKTPTSYPPREPKTYLVDIGGRIYQRTREHL